MLVGPKWSRKHHAPISRRSRVGSARRICMPSPSSALRAGMRCTEGAAADGSESSDEDGWSGGPVLLTELGSGVRAGVDREAGGARLRNDEQTASDRQVLHEHDHLHLIARN